MRRLNVPAPAPMLRGMSTEQRPARRRREIAARLREARLRAGLSQAGLGRLVEPRAAGATVSNWERGVAALDLPLLEELARVLDQPLAFFTGEVPPRRDDALAGLGREVLQAAQRRGLATPAPGPARVVALAVLGPDGRPGAATRDVPTWLLAAGLAEPVLIPVPDDGLRALGIVVGDHLIVDAARVAWDGWALVAVLLDGAVAVRVARLRDGALELGSAGGSAPPAAAAAARARPLGVATGLLATGPRPYLGAPAPAS